MIPTTRRDFLRLVGGTAGAALLASCAPGAVAPQGQQTAAGTTVQDLPKVHIWASPRCTPEGSNRERLAAVKQYIMDQIGIEPVAVVAPTGDAGQERLNLLLGSRSEALDLFVQSWPDYQQAIIPLNDLLEEHGQAILKAVAPINMAGMKDSEGTIWGIPRLGVMAHTTPTWFRTDWLAEAGLSLPQTLEDTEEAMAAFKELNPDAMIVSQLNMLRLATVGGFTEFGYSRWWNPQMEVLSPPELQPGFADWVARMNQWWQNNWFFKETFGSWDRTEVLKTLNVGIWADWYSAITIAWEQLRLTGEMGDADYDFYPQFSGPAGLMKTLNVSATSAYMITQKAQDPAAVMKYLNWQYENLPDDPTNTVIAHWGEPGVDWEWEDPAEKFHFRRLIEGCGEEYAGEFGTSFGLATEHTYAPLGGQARHYAHIQTWQNAVETGKLPMDYDVPYDITRVREHVPNAEDIDRLRDEEVTKFITGVRPLSEWDAFVDTLYSAGLQQWMEAYTEQFLQYHPDPMEWLDEVRNITQL